MSEVDKVHMEGRRWHRNPHMTAAALSDVAVFRFTDKRDEVAEAGAVCSMKCSVKFRSFNGEMVAGLTDRGSGESLPTFLMADVIHVQLPRRKPTSSLLAGICGPDRFFSLRGSVKCTPNF